MEKYSELKVYLEGILKTAKKLGLNVQPGGGYTMGYDISNLPPYPVGLYGALSIIEGPGARCKLGLTFDQTQSLEAGFNGIFPDTKNKKKKKRKNFDIDAELVKLGAELSFSLRRQPRRSKSFYNNYDYPPPPMPEMPIAPVPLNPAVEVFSKWEVAPKKKASAFQVPGGLYIDDNENAVLKEAILNEKKKQLIAMMMEAQPAEMKQAEKIKQVLDEMAMQVKMAPDPGNE